MEAPAPDLIRGLVVSGEAITIRQRITYKDRSLSIRGMCRRTFPNVIKNLCWQVFNGHTEIMKHRFLDAVYIGSLAAMSLVGLGYDSLSLDLAAPGPDGPFFCRELQSSGGDDSLMVLVFGTFTIPLLLRVIRFGRQFSSIETATFSICLGLTLVSLWIASLDCASLLYTAIFVPDPLLAIALIAIPVATTTLLALRVVR
ncbi:hypothetical protein [Salipiger abyssi]|uniref:hypothetical protein n=1 Tax=Salipiger abyssi TaxID=1250539 RepID=UPI000978A812|nr:hypothetical protein [Salipiger abyssi]